MDSTITVANAALQTVASYPVPASLDSVAELDGRTVVLFSGSGVMSTEAGGAALLDLGNGAVTSLSTLIGREGRWQRLALFEDSITFGDTTARTTVVVPRDNPLEMWEVPVIVTAHVDDT